MKKIPLILFAFLHLQMLAQKLEDHEGLISFEASVRSFEPVMAHTNQANCKLNTKNGSIEASVNISGFMFKMNLMKEHFNDNYLQSKRYPQATFKGKIKDFNFSMLTDQPVRSTVRGKLRIRGESNEISAPITLKKTTDGVEVIVDFAVNTDDYHIGIPALVRNKVSKNVSIHAEFTLR